jgi:hypothetical protein
MTNQETKELAKTLAHGSVLGKDYMARSISAMIRAARTTKTQNELMAIAVDHKLTDSPDFITG